MNNFLEKVSAGLSDTELFSCCIIDLLESLSSFDDFDVLTSTNITELKESLDTYRLKIEPALTQGGISDIIDRPLIIYRNLGDVDFSSTAFRQARLVSRLAVIMARIDFSVDDEERRFIKTQIYRQPGISSGEKLFLYAKAEYLLKINYSSSEKTRDYFRIALSKSALLSKFEEIDDAAKEPLVELAMDLAVCDGVLDKRELTFIKELYRLSGRSVRSAQRDLEKHAEAQRIILDESRLQKAAKPSVELDELDELENVMDDLLSEFAF